MVDDDVDIRDPRQVAWALATRFQASNDLIVLDGMEGYVIDPSSAGGNGSKIGFDATRGAGPEFEKIAMPSDAVGMARRVAADLSYQGKQA